MPTTTAVGLEKKYVVPEMTTSSGAIESTIPSAVTGIEIKPRGATVVWGKERPPGPATMVSVPIVRVVVGAPGPTWMVWPSMTAMLVPMSRGMPSTVMAVNCGMSEAAGVGRIAVKVPLTTRSGSRVSVEPLTVMMDEPWLGSW